MTECQTPLPSPVTPVHLLAKEPLSVRLTKDSPSWRRFLWLPAAVAVLVVVYAALWLWFVFPRGCPDPVPGDLQIGGLGVGLSYPQYIALGDEGYIDVTITNQSDRVVTGTLTLVSTGSLPVHTVPREDNVVSFVSLPTDGQIAERIHLVINKQPVLLSRGKILFWLRAVTTEDPRQYESGKFAIAISPLSHLNTIRWLVGVTIAFLFVLLRDVFGKLLLPS